MASLSSHTKTEAETSKTEEILLGNGKRAQRGERVVVMDRFNGLLDILMQPDFRKIGWKGF